MGEFENNKLELLDGSKLPATGDGEGLRMLIVDGNPGINECTCANKGHQEWLKQNLDSLPSQMVEVYSYECTNYGLNVLEVDFTGCTDDPTTDDPTTDIPTTKIPTTTPTDSVAAVPVVSITFLTFMFLYF